MPRITLSPRVQRLLSGACAALICGAGTYVLSRELDSHYPVQEWLVWRLAPIWAYVLLFNASCLAFGSFLARRLLGDRELPAVERLLHSMVLGLTAFVLALYLLGFLGLFKPWVALLLPVAFLAVGFQNGRQLAIELVAWRASIACPKLTERVLGSLAILGGAAALTFLYLEALDVSAINFDATWYHFPIAQDYAREGRIVPFPGEEHRAYPHLTSMLHTWALLVPRLPRLPQHWMLALHLEYSIVLWRIVGAAALARWLLGGRDVRGLWAGFFLFPSIFVYDQSIGGSADHFLGFFAAPALLAAARALRSFDVRWGVLLGVALGGHILVKYQAIYLVGGIGVAVVLRLAILVGQHLIRSRRSLGVVPAAPWRSLRNGAGGIALVTVLVSSPHFVKNAVFYNNPVYPFAKTVFKSSFPQRGPGYYQEKTTPGTFSPKHEGLRRQAWVLGKIFTFPLETANRGLTGKRPYMGALFSLLLPCALFVQGRRRLLLTVGVLVVAFLLWGNTAANDRYLLSFYDVCIGLALALMVRVWDLGWPGRAGLVPLVGLQLIWGGDAMLYHGRKRLDQGLDLIGAGYARKYDEERFSEKGAQQQVTRATPANAVILARNYKGLLGLDRNVLSDIRAAQDFISYSHLKDAREFYDLLKSRGVTHLLYPRGQRKPTSWNNIILWNELFLRHATGSKRFGKLWLAQLPAVRPPAAAPYLVLVSGIREYPEGIYAVEQLDVDSRLPGAFSPKPRPLHRLSKENIHDLLPNVRALVVGRRRLPKLLSAEALAAFESVEILDGDELYLRKVGTH